MSAGASLSLLPLPGLPSPCPALPAWLPIWLAVAKTKCLPFYYCWLLDNTLLGAVYLSLLFLKQNNPAKMNSDKLSRCIVNFTKELSWRGFSQSQSHSSVWLLSPADEKWCWRERWIRLCCNNYVLTSPWHNIVHQIWLFIPFQYHASFRRPKIYELSPLFSFFFLSHAKISTGSNARFRQERTMGKASQWFVFPSDRRGEGGGLFSCCGDKRSLLFFCPLPQRWVCLPSFFWLI